MSRTRASVVFSLLVVVGVGLAAVRNRPQPIALPSAELDRPIPVRPDAKPYEPYKFLYTTDQSISVYRDRIQRDPDDYSSRTTLGALYLRRAKETGDGSDIDRANELFEAALKLFPKYGPAKVGRLHVLLAKHRFSDAMSAAEALRKDDPEEPELRVVAFDANLELGKYEVAEVELRAIEKQLGDPPPPAIQARRARLLELHGDPDGAIALLNRALESERLAETSRVSLSWYSSRCAELLLSQGKLDGATAAIERAILDNPGSPGLKVILAKVRLAQGRAKEAVAILDELLKADRELEAFVAKVGDAQESNALKSSIANSQNFDTYLLFGDVLAAAGEPDRAKEAYAMADRKVDRESPVAVRELILNWCDRSHRLPKALELAAKEAKARRDVESCDSLAWVLFKNGKLAEAEAAAKDALRLGTKDSIFHFHAGLIAKSRGQSERAREHFRTALRINPSFSGSHVAEARRLLAE